MAVNHTHSSLSLSAYQITHILQSEEANKKVPPRGVLAEINTHDPPPSLLPPDPYTLRYVEVGFWHRQKQGISRQEGVRRFGYRASMHDSLGNTGGRRQDRRLVVRRILAAE